MGKWQGIRTPSRICLVSPPPWLDLIQFTKVEKITRGQRDTTWMLKQYSGAHHHYASALHPFTVHSIINLSHLIFIYLFPLTFFPCLPRFLLPWSLLMNAEMWKAKVITLMRNGKIPAEMEEWNCFESDTAEKERLMIIAAIIYCRAPHPKVCLSLLPSSTN